MRVICIGHLNWDTSLFLDRLPVPDGESEIRSERAGPGGSAANVAAALAGLGVEVGLIACCGDDEHGRQSRQHLVDAGVDVSGVSLREDLTTEVKYLLVDPQGEVSLIGRPGSADALRASAIDRRLLAGADHVHLTGVRTDTAARAVSVARGQGSTLSLDPGRRASDRGSGGLAAQVDWLLVNQRELEALLPKRGGIEHLGSNVIVKRGREGATAYHDGGQVDYPALDIYAQDTSGAGDAFAAGFLAAWLRGDPIPSAMRLATACAGIACEQLGAHVQLSSHQIARYLSKTPRDSRYSG